jgi:hypothetical protein
MWVLHFPSKGIRGSASREDSDWRLTGYKTVRKSYGLKEWPTTQQSTDTTNRLQLDGAHSCRNRTCVFKFQTRLVITLGLGKAEVADVPKQHLCQDRPAGRLHLKCDGTRAETRFRLSANRTSPFKSAGASVQSTTGSRGVRISDSNAGYTMFRGNVKSNGYPLHSPVSPSPPPRASPCAITIQLDSTKYLPHWHNLLWGRCPSSFPEDDSRSGVRNIIIYYKLDDGRSSENKYYASKSYTTVSAP